MNVRIDFRIMSGLLAIALIGVLLIWKPWDTGPKRTIDITGQATVKAAPDQFTFSPTYEKSAKTNQDAIGEVSKVGNEVVNKLKELGVEEKQITTNVSANPTYSAEPLSSEESIKIAPVPPTNQGSIAYYNIVVTIQSQELAQKITDYLVTTPAQYGITPMSTFSTETQKKLEREARGKALESVKAQAESDAAKLGMRLGKVVSVKDAASPFSGPIPLERTLDATTSSKASPIVLTGEQEVTFVVTVTYEIK